MATAPPKMDGTATASGGPEEKGERAEHEQESEEREAYEYWGYLFKPDKTGTDKLRSLLRGLKEVMNIHYEPSDNPDLTPNQLAHFYRELHGNYDQLFLGTPSESIAFIYKSLGCLHSLQPLSHSTAFTGPTVPALKTEGWIMWQTIQLLLGPEEHSSFLVEAVQTWDVRDPATGEVFPKLLPRRCFPLEPDKHMVAWYEGVSERLRREAEDEGRQRETEAEQAEVRRLHDRVRREDTDDEGSVDSRGPALAYFRNPLYRHVDGRPTIVRHNSKRPALSPRPTSMMGKGKEAASTMGHVIRNIGSPHLWDGRRPSESRDRDRDRRRRSLPDDRFHHPGDSPPAPASAAYDSMLSPNYHQHRRRSSQQDRLGAASTSDNEWAAEDGGPSYSPRPSPRPRQHHHHRDDLDPTLRHSRSHEPTPSQKEYPDYFHGYDDPDRRSTSAYDENADAGTPLSSNGVGPGFGPSASPLFASHIAKQPQPPPSHPPQQRLPQPEPYGPPRAAPSVRRTQDQGRPYSRSPDPSSRHRERDDRRYESRERRSRFEQSPAPSSSAYAGSAPPPGPPAHQQPGFPPVGQPGPGGYPPGPVRSSDTRRSGRMSGSDVSAYSGAEDRDGGRRRSRPNQKQARFAAGVDGRRYPSEAPWR